ncbi:hypothetical protein VaNZ11_001919 [Volvox africanus]|uniref:CTLH/CRA C-terminal to LisH motif domain-containing protein n=1 Tax=Volvox africanus TaxID=51714 RepID=A0ABQ5RRB4_9CHLO|nr:hypothetical protein VaNZ11_001919 [Volvox africanus]
MKCLQSPPIVHKPKEPRTQNAPHQVVVPARHNERVPTRGSKPAACARSELAPLALHAYPEAYVEFKRLLLLLLLLPQHKTQPQQQQTEDADGQQEFLATGRNLVLPEAQEEFASASPMGIGGSSSSAAAVLCSSMGSAGLWDPESTTEFADQAYFTVRSMLGLQQPLLSLQLRFLLRLYGSYPASTSTSGGALASELAPRLRNSGAGGGNRDPAPLPPLTAPGGVGPPSFPESAMQAVIQGAGTSRQAATDAMKRYGGNAFNAFKAEVGRLRLNEHLLAELALEYGTFRGLFSAEQAEALKTRAAVGGCGGGKTVVPEPFFLSSYTDARAYADYDEDERSRQRFFQNAQRLYQQQQQQQQQCCEQRRGQYADSQQQEQEQHRPQWRNALTSVLAEQLLPATAPGPLGLARGDASREGASPPNKVARRSPPSDEDGGDDSGSGKVDQETQQGDADVEMEGDWLAADAAAGTEAAAGAGAAVAPMETAPVPEAAPVSDFGSGSGSGSGSGACGKLRLQGQEIISALLRLGQEGDADGVLSLVEATDPQLWDEHPHLLFDVRRCQYGKLLAEGQTTAALELARRELTPLANAHPALLPHLKSAMAALLPPLQPVRQTSQAAANAAAAPSGANASTMATIGGATTATATATSTSSSPNSKPSLLPCLPAVVGAIQGVLQPRLGLQGPRLVRLMEGLLASHRAWMRAERMISDPFAEAMKINALRVTPPAVTAPAAAAAALASQARQPSGSANATAAAVTAAAAVAAAAALLPPLLPPPPQPPRPAGFTGGMSARARELERALREAGAPDRVLLQPWFEMEQQLLAQMALPFGRTELRAGPGAPGAGGALFGVFGGGLPGILPDDDDVQGGGEGGGGGGMAPEDNDSGGEGMEVDEEGVLRLMEVLELPRGAAVELLQNHDGDVQTAILSVMQ